LNRPQPNALVALALVALVGAAAPALAGEPLGTDLFAGYSFARVSETSRHGADLALGFHAIGALAGFVDLGAHWGSESGVGVSDLTLMAGPGLRFGKRGGTLACVRVLAGVLRDRASISVLDVEISQGETHFALLAGGGIDVRLRGRFALRAQGDYLWHYVTAGTASCPTGSSSCSAASGASGVRVSAGVVYRFGAGP
jgi:hypothetical protein